MDMVWMMLGWLVLINLVVGTLLLLLLLASKRRDRATVIKAAADLEAMNVRRDLEGLLEVVSPTGTPLMHRATPATIKARAKQAKIPAARAAWAVDHKGRANND